MKWFKVEVSLMVEDDMGEADVERRLDYALERTSWVYKSTFHDVEEETD